MKMDEILELIQELACSQGFYGRLYRDLMDIKNNDVACWNSLKDEWESQNFESSLDFVLYIEQ